MTDLQLISSLWPLSLTSEYADLFGCALCPGAPQQGALAQASGAGVLRSLERTRPRAELELELAAVLALLPERAHVRAELEAALASEQRDWVEQPCPDPLPELEPMALLYYAPQACVEEEAGYGETPAWTERALAGASLSVGGERSATDAELERAHDSLFLQELFELGRLGGAELTPETFVSPSSEAAVRAGAGALIAAVSAALAGEPRLQLCLARPGSHHAARARAGGTCLVNNLAVAALAALAQGATSVAVVDLDAHHGNGTEQIFLTEPRVATLSVQQAQPFFPGSGDSSEGVANLNLPVAPGADWLQRVLAGLTWVAASKPELILVELSTDAHAADPASDLTGSDADFYVAGAALAAIGAPVVIELGSALSERGFLGGLRSFLNGLTAAQKP